MQKLTAIIDNKRAIVITEDSREGCRQGMAARFGKRFKGFADDVDRPARKQGQSARQA